jgi:hypothetical protein
MPVDYGDSMTLQGCSPSGGARGQKSWRLWAVLTQRETRHLLPVRTSPGEFSLYAKSPIAHRAAIRQIRTGIAVTFLTDSLTS